MKIGLSLGGGGARGYAHIGVLRALNEAGIHIDLINGSSMGAIIGGAYALYADITKITTLVNEVIHKANIKQFNTFRYFIDSQKFLRDWLINAICDLSTIRNSINSNKRNLKALQLIFRDYEFDHTQIPFSCVAIDTLSGDIVIIREGKLVDGILASTAIPGVFPPVKLGGRLLFDGGVLAEVPVRECQKQGAEFIIAVKLDVAWETKYHNGFDIINRIKSLQQWTLSEWELEEADFTFRVDLTDFDSMSFNNYENTIATGYNLARQALPTLIRKLANRNV